MTPGEDAARQALKQSLETNKVEVHLAQETIRVLRHELRLALEEREAHPACKERPFLCKLLCPR